MWWRMEVVLMPKSQKVPGSQGPRSQGPNDQDISKSYSNTSLTLKKVHLVSFIFPINVHSNSFILNLIKLKFQISLSNFITIMIIFRFKYSQLLSLLILFREPTLKMFAQNGSIPQQRQQHAHIQNQTQPSLEVVEVTVDQTLESHPEQGRTAGPDISPH